MTNYIQKTVHIVFSPLLLEIKYEKKNALKNPGTNVSIATLTTTALILYCGIKSEVTVQHLTTLTQDLFCVSVI